MVKNGQLDVGTLVEIRKNLYLKANAAWWFNKMSEDFQKHFGYPIGVTDAYRTLASQVRLKKEKGPFAAKPGTSNHGWGVALDLGTRINSFTSAEHKWMVAHGHEYGWVNPAWARDNNPGNGQQEPWHWEHDDRPIPHAGAAVVKNSKRKVGKPMIYRAGNDKKTPFGIYAHNGGWVILKTNEERANLMRAGVPEVWVEKQTLDNLIADARS